MYHSMPYGVGLGHEVRYKTRKELYCFYTSAHSLSGPVLATRSNLRQQEITVYQCRHTLNILAFGRYPTPCAT